jgi:hypothetical protein
MMVVNVHVIVILGFVIFMVQFNCLKGVIVWESLFIIAIFYQ